MNEGQACLRSLTFETTPSKMDQVRSTAAMVSVIHKLELELELELYFYLNTVNLSDKIIIIKKLQSTNLYKHDKHDKSVTKPLSDKNNGTKRQF